MTICLDIENVLVRLVNVQDIEEMNALKEIQEAEGNFYEYILVDKSAWKTEAQNETDSVTVYKIRKTL